MMLAFSNIFRCQRLIQNPVQLLIRNWHKEAIPVSWEKPEIGWTKLNFDGSCKGRGGKASIGGVFRNHKAEFLLGYAESIGRSTSTIAELAALRRGLELVLENGWTDVWLEGDAKTLVDVIVQRRQVKCAELQRHVSHINLIIPELNNCIVTHIYREGNRAADKLAQIGHQLKKPQIWWHIPPNEVLPIVHEDAEGEIKAGQWKSVINRKLSKFYHLTYQSSGPYLEPEAEANIWGFPDGRHIIECSVDEFFHFLPTLSQMNSPALHSIMCFALSGNEGHQDSREY
ncbi:Polynucleotidyl transferase [Theobroma cacao]|uniref:Polynucleotidyl transferase n=1 Tax=Theobroma cacao TaxID=3641 RepID=A0A061GEZ6_THECC|nr:Polynucleotidyl transferase [Theobroma cacao]